MSINMKSLSPDTYRSLEKVAQEFGWEEIFGWQEPEDVAWLAARLEFVDDTPERFPKGKWATIQRLQDLVREAAKAAVEDAREEKP